jgi:hypothetical protein
LLAVVAAAVVFCTFPGGVVPLNDGFGYLRSIALTYEHGRPWTDEWLGPWSAGFSVLGATVFGLTGSMYLATYGVCAALMGVAAWAACKLFARAGATIAVSLALTALLLLFPTVLWKFLEINGFALYFSCLLLALLAYERSNWTAFALVWCVALSTRQSAVAWGALPAYAAISHWRRGSPVGSHAVLRPLVTVAVAGLFFGFLMRYMNHTQAQLVVTDRVFANWRLGDSLHTLPIVLLVAGVGYGLGSLTLGGRNQESAGWLRLLAVVLALPILYIGAAVDLRTLIDFDHAAFQVPVFHVYLQGLCVVGGIGMLRSALRIRGDFLLAASACTLVLLLRNAAWDYYLVDAFVFALLAAPAKPAASRQSRFLPWALGALACLSLSFVVYFKARYDREYAVATTGWHALTRGAIPWSDASFLPFGVMGWHFHPYYATHEGKDSADLADFGRYLRHDVVGVAFRYQRHLRWLPGFDGTIPGDKATIIERERHRFCWAFYLDVALVRLPAAEAKPAKTPYPPTLVPAALPVDDAGWRAALRR